MADFKEIAPYEVPIGDTPLKVNAESYVLTDIGQFLKSIGIESVNPGEINKCTNCNERKEIAIKYKVVIEINICKDCMLKQVDKLFGLNFNKETENILYK